MNRPILNMVIALHCEAKALIESLKLKKIIDTSLPFSIYTNSEMSIYLIISGVGKIKAAIATTFLAQYTGNHNHACYFNFGIAGGSTRSNIGEIVLINKLMDVSTQRNWYPFTSHLKFIKRCGLSSHDLPQTTYPDKGVIDMEASAFYQAATCFVTQEQVQILKIISDNPSEHQNQINENYVKELIIDKLSLISNFIIQLLQLSELESKMTIEPVGFKTFLSQWHFTHSEQIQLKEYLRRWQLQLPNENSFLYCQNEKQSNQVIKKIIMKLDQHANCIY
ncbi:MAG: 5'-methylthioadenosine/S-adenosylhomocysteine nucleosidase family protein [Gammaproteobacteria bacterium]